MVGDVVLAVEEAMTNAVRHSASAEPLEVRLGFSGPDLHAEVSDRGRGFDVAGFDPRRMPDLLQSGGRGLYLISRLMDEVDLRADGGVDVRMVKRGARPEDARRPLSLSAIPSGADLERGGSYREVRERSLVEEIPEGFAALDWEYSFTYANDLALATYHLERGEVLGRCIWDLFPNIKEAELGLAIRESMELGAPAILEWDSPYLQRTLEFRIYPTSSGISFYMRDIQERRQRERERDEYFQALLRSEERFRSLYENMTEAVALGRLVEEDGRPVDYFIEDVNPAFRGHIGSAPEEVRGKSVRELSGFTEPPLLQEYAEVVRSGRPLSTEIYLPALDRHLRVGALSLGGDRFAAVFEDITEHKRVDAEREELLSRLERELAFTQLLAKVAATATGALRIEEVAERTLAGIRDDLGDLRAGSVYLTDEQRGMLRHLALFGYPRPARDDLRELPLSDDSNIGRAALTGTVITHETPGEPAGSVERRARLGLADVRWIVLPIERAGETLGVMALFFEGRRPFPDDEVRLYEGIAAILANALKNAALFEAQRRVATTLQENFMHALPAVPGLELAAVSLPAYQPELVGGDFHDVFVLPDGMVVAVIGDVMGKGIQAAGLTETVRSAVRALALASPSPGYILGQVARLLLLDETEQFVSCQLVLLDPRTGKAFAGSAGHPPAVRFGRSSPEPLELRYGPLLGTFDSSYFSSPLHLAPGEGLLLYTDGVTEARGPGRRLFGEQRLLEAVAAAPEVRPAALVEDVRRAVQMWAGRLEDDLQLLAVRRAGPSR